MLWFVALLLVIIIIILNIISKKVEKLIEKVNQQWIIQQDIYRINHSIYRYFDKEYDKLCHEALIRKARKEHEYREKNEEKLLSELRNTNWK